MTLKTIFISTGEVSGDLQGALLIEALKRQGTAAGLELEIVALGGDQMAQAGAKLLGNTTSIGSVGILESLPFVLPTLKVQGRAKQYLRQQTPDLVVLIDYMGPNLSIGSFLKGELPQVPVVYYIAPQEWVWSISKGNTRMIVEMTDRMLAIFPEEARYFVEKGASVSWVGHPLVDRMESSPSREEARATLGIAPEQTAIALLPASRQQEIKYLMPVVFEAAKQLQSQLLDTKQTGQLSQSKGEGLRESQADSPLFWIPLSLEAYRHPIEEAVQRYGLQAKVVAGQTKQILAAADLAITKSGTVNLELALLDVPQVVFYRVNPFTYWLARTFLKFSIPFMSPPNLVVMRSIVPELLQEQATPENIVRESLELLFNQERRQQTLKDYQEMRQLLGEVGVCDRAAQEIFQLIN
ncbi:MAG: lipid-A-disaccharide synthase [Moorea sp. SIO3I7]|uniref:lipid-A-disaccharide synthase n=1 Tax=Moorena sp. SIO3I8 TaxID=2607833 RepID=UPI0013C00982|nr:lipid-A-disaccharide synthase [Moorena sp. SIO3I8]NEO01061.1 lipid-A-disaccharide synthase [Moorena sp. SIO3I7]NEO08476.1 lipid-A-disaccharide synthase [Moorena sp. SIO3I8]